MRFFNEDDFISYKQYLMQSVNDAVKNVTGGDNSIRAILIGEFPDGNSRFVSFHPNSQIHHKHHPEYDHFGSLIVEMIPNGMNMVVIEVDNDKVLCGTAEGY